MSKIDLFVLASKLRSNLAILKDNDRLKIFADYHPNCPNTAFVAFVVDVVELHSDGVETGIGSDVITLALRAIRKRKSELIDWIIEEADSFVTERAILAKEEALEIFFDWLIKNAGSVATDTAQDDLRDMHSPHYSLNSTIKEPNGELEEMS